MLNEFVYCPRLFYYEHVEGAFTHNADTCRGAALHKRVDAGKGALPAAKPGPEKEKEPSSTTDPSENAAEIENPKSEIENSIIHSRSRPTVSA